jgi:hypothetical protein
MHQLPHLIANVLLLVDLGNNTSTNGAATFADSEAQTLVHGDRSKQLNLEGDVSPGMTISLSAGSSTSPVTSVVRK